ncbi:MAG: hypothetical protein ABFD97_04335 [Syntrophobacter sp.]
MDKRRPSKGLAGIYLFLAAMLASGCTAGYDLVEKGMGAVELLTPGDRYMAITYANAYQDGIYLVVSGSIVAKSSESPPAGYDAHVDVAVLAPDGKLADKRSLDILLGESSRHEFRIRFPYFAKLGTLLRVAYHGGLRLTDDVSNCGETFQ